MTATQFNKDFRIVFQPKDVERYGKRRFAIGAGKLAYYIGEENAKKAFEKAYECTDDKIRIKFRVAGWVDFYVK